MPEAPRTSLKSPAVERPVSRAESRPGTKSGSRKQSSHGIVVPEKSPQFGRRAGQHRTKDDTNGDVSKKNSAHNSWFKEVDKAYTPPPKDSYANNVSTIADGEDDQTHREEQRKRQEEREKFSKKIVEMPTNYQAPMPSLKDLDIHCNWDRLLQTIHSEFDMSCLTTCLSRELDEDIAWNPEMLLVQLSSDMRDAAEVKNADEVVFLPADAQEVGHMSGGEVIRRRREEVAAKNDAEPGSLPEKVDKGKNNAEGLLFSNSMKRSESLTTKAVEPSGQEGRKSIQSRKHSRSSKSSHDKTNAPQLPPNNS